MSTLNVSLLVLLLSSSLPTLALVPTIAELAPIALPERRLQSLPQVQNFVGAVGLRHDLVSLGTMALTPFNGNFQNSSLFIDNEPAVLTSSRYGACEGTRSGAAGVVGIVNQVRLPFEQHAVLQKWTLATGDQETHSLTANFDGPFFRSCDLSASDEGSCGWGTNFPVDRPSFVSTFDTNTGTMLSVDSKTGVAVASRLWFSGSAGNVTANVIGTNSTFAISATFRDTSGADVVQLLQAMAVGNSAPEALTALFPLMMDSGFASSFDDACELFEARWQSAFQVPVKDGGTGTHFGGNLPILSSNRPEIDRLYYWAALAFISLERTNLKSGPRQFVISQGPSNSLDGSAGMGGSGQFIWDLSFAALSMSLLEPDAVRDQCAFVMNSTQNIIGAPPAVVPQCWDSFPDYGHVSPAMGSYRFDYYSAFLHVMTYVAANNASDWLRKPLTASSPTTGVDFLIAMARSREGYPPSQVSPWLADYGENKRDFLEVVPTYVGVVPGLQFGNAAMALATARLLEQTGLHASDSGAFVRSLRANASAIAAAALEHLWNDEDGGAWRCLYPEGNSTAVRSINDFVYVAQSIGFMARDDTLNLPANVANASLKFFWEELLSPGDAWVRALSLKDPLCKNVMSETPGIEDLLALRADWGCLGSYGGIPGFAVESPAHLTQSFDGMIAALSQIAPVALTAAPSQGVALGTPTYYALHFNGDRAPDDVPSPPFSCAFPEFFDEGGDWPLFWPDTERYVQNAEASFVDVIVRTLFGWRPEWVTPAAAPRSPEAAAIIDRSLYLASTPRNGFNGTLSNLRTPLGYINITASSNGLTWTWS